ncbi:hypothetical protein [Enterococcus sp. AZ163]|uniref:hypothetical protein n=1 Tax=Enterococcus sp. AZ163 TaxID=2774638 RepID=UPI003D299D24
MKKVLFIMFVFAVGLSACSNTENTKSSDENSQSSTIETTAVEKSKEDIAIDVAERYENMNFDSYNTGIQIDDFERYPDDNIGNKSYFLAKVFQVLETDGENNHYLATVNLSETETKTVLLLVSKNETYKNIIKGDELRVFVHFVEIFNYETTSGSNNQVPAFYIDAYKIEE